MIGHVLLAVCCTLNAGDGKDAFQPLLDHLAAQDGFWALNNRAVADAFFRCFDTASNSNDADRALLTFVRDNNDRAYWIGGYLTEPYYLRGRRARPLLALAIWTNASERLDQIEEATQDDVLTQRNLNELAAVLAKRLGCDALARTLKARSEAARLKIPGGPATDQDHDTIYDSIPHVRSKTIE